MASREWTAPTPAGGRLYGEQTRLAIANFPITGRPVHPELIAALGAVKLAAARTNAAIGKLEPSKASAIVAACQEVAEGQWLDEFPVDSLQGGAGTSTHLNICEVIAARANQILGKTDADFEAVHPVEDVNLHQSTNDVFPTAVRVAALRLLHGADGALLSLVGAFQEKERDFQDVVKVGRTEMQDAVLTTLGRTFGCYAEAFARDRWRVSKCVERLRVVNLGGTAIGTGLGAPRAYIFRVVDELRDVTRLGLSRAENLVEATQNLDPFVEVMGILKAWATNLVKVGNDLRLMASGPEAGLGEISLPALQAGSSIMPGKVNPVMAEAAVQAGLFVMGAEHSLSLAVAMGNLELNAFLPLVARTLLESIETLSRASQLLADRCIRGVVASTERCAAQVAVSSASATALVPRLGYVKAGEILALARERGVSVKTVVLEKGFLSEEEFAELTSAHAALRLGS